MGIFEKFRKKQKETDLKEIENVEQKDFEVEYNMSDDGKLQIDFYDKKIKFGQDYDTTRLIVSNRPIILAGEKVSNCAVSWYNQSDVVFNDLVFNDPQYCNESIDARDYKVILAQIDTALLQKDENYCSAVMRKLLNKSRVNKYIEDGLQEHPEHPCGKYIGGIKTEEGYSKFFSMQVGKASHDSDFMVNRRKEYRESIEAEKQRKIAEKRDRIQQLNDEIDELLK